MSMRIKRNTGRERKIVPSLAGEGPEPEHGDWYRLLIMTYELGDAARAIVYRERFPSEAEAHEPELKLAIADLYTMLRKFIIIDKGWSEQEIKRLGEKHMRERYKEFKGRGWAPVDEK